MLKFIKLESVMYDERGQAIIFDDASPLWRSKIPKGWIVVIADVSAPAGVTFIPDPNHTWDGSSFD